MFGSGCRRMVERFGDDLLDGVNMLVMLMQGTPMTYYGDEIGMVDGTQQFDSDPEKRQNYRTPMQVGGTQNLLTPVTSITMNQVQSCTNCFILCQ